MLPQPLLPHAFGAGDARACDTSTSNIHRDLIMTLTDAIIVLLLAEKIHGTDAAIRKSAKNVAKKLPRSKRGVMYDIVESKSPRALMHHIALGLDDCQP